MAFSFNPAILKNAVLHKIPRPVLAVRIQDSWDFDQFKVPLADGDNLVGHSQQGVDIFIEGQVGTQEGNLKASEEDMFFEIESLRTVLNIDSDTDKYDFFIYYDAGSGTYRRFSDCTTVRFEYDLSNKNIFTYSIVIHADNPTLYTTVS